MKVTIDPGHGGNSASKRGFYGQGYENNEGVNNFLTAVLIKEYLESKYVVEVVLTRNKVEDYPTLTERGKVAEGADLFYSVHSNAYSDKSVRGTEMWVGTGSDEAAELGRDLCTRISEFFGHRNRGIKNGDSYIVVRKAKENGAKMSIMAEIGFHTSPSDADILINKRVELAELQGERIATALGLKLKPRDLAPDGKLFQVAIGAFGSRKNAQEIITKAKAAGLNPYLVIIDDPRR